MAKKIIAIVCLIAVLAVCFTGCSFITKNEERDLNQVVTTVNYAGRTATVTKGEVQSLYTQQGYLYIQYYGWTVEKTINQLVDTLSNTALLSLQAKDYLEKTNKITLKNSTVGNAKPTVEQMIAEMQELLNNKYRKEAIDATNDIFQKSFDDIYKEVVDENKTAEDKADNTTTTDEKKEEELVRPNQPVDEEDKEDKDIELPKYFFEIKNQEIKKMETTRDNLIKEINDLKTKTSDEDKASLEKKQGEYNDVRDQIKYTNTAIERLNKSLEKQYKDYNYYLNSQLKSKLISYYEEKITEEVKSNPNIDALVLEKYEEMKKADLINLDTKDAYIAKLKEQDKGIIVHQGNMVDKNFKGYFYVKNILVKFSPEQEALLKEFKNADTANEESIKKYRDYLAKQITVDVSNPDFDATKDEDAETNPKYKYKDTDGKNIPIQTIITDMTAELDAAATKADKIKVYLKWTYLINEDTGVFKSLKENKPDYLISPEGEKTEFMQEFTDYARKLYDGGVSNYKVSDKEIYTVTDYGIHFIMISKIPFDYPNKGFNIDNEKYVVGLDALIDVEKDQTLKMYLKEIVEKEIGKDAYTNKVSKLYKESEGNDKIIKKNDNLVKSIIKTYEGLTKNAQQK